MHADTEREGRRWSPSLFSSIYKALYFSKPILKVLQCIKCPHYQTDITPVIRKSANQNFVNSGLQTSDWYVFEGQGFVEMICGSGSEGFVQ